MVAAGTSEDIVKAKRSYTGQFLKPVLQEARRMRDRGRVEDAEVAERHRA